jgi:hypothetical protein
LSRLHLLEAHPDVGLDVLDEVAEVDGAIGVGQGGSDEDLAGHGICLGIRDQLLLQKISTSTFPQIENLALLGCARNCNFLSERLLLAWAGTFFPHEIMTGGHLLEWWGGAFEIATFDNGSIRKRSNVLFTLWRLIPNIDGSYQLALAPRFIKQHYFDDALIVQDLKVVIQGNGCIGMPTLSVHTVLPLLKNEPDYDFSMLQLGDFSHTMLCVYVLPIDGAECDEVFTKIISDDAGVRNIQLAVDTNSVKIGVEGSFVSELAGC